MIKRIIIVVLVLACLLCLTACKSIDYGTVIDKKFAPAHTVYSPIIMVINKRTRVMPYWRHVPDSWEVWVQNEDGTAQWNVSEEYYNSVNIGDYVDRRN